jgi:hypothetical protein
MLVLQKQINASGCMAACVSENQKEGVMVFSVSPKFP